MIRLTAALLMLSLALTACEKQQTATATDQPTYLFDDVRLISMTPGTPAVQASMDVLIAGDTITAIAPALEVPDGATVIDGNGKTLLPGLIDMHVHIWDETELGAFLSHGVTTVRNLSGMPLHFELIDRIEAGRLTGPRIITTGPIMNSPGPNAAPNHLIVSTAEEARAAVARQQEQGFDHIKVYSNLTREAYEAIKVEAAARGMSLSGHTPEGAREDGVPFEKPFAIAFEEILDDGFVTIEHVESIVWHALYDDLDENKARILARQIAAAGVTVDPTLIAHHALQKMAETNGAWNERPESGLLNPLLRQVETENYAFWAGQSADLRRDHDAFYARTTRIFHEEGVRMVTGTDAGIFTNIPGAALTRELELLTSAGIPAYDVLTMATLNGAETLGLGERLGQVSAGYQADLILVDGDPLEDISVVEHPTGVMTGGTWMTGEALSTLHDSAFDGDAARTQANFEAYLASIQ